MPPPDDLARRLLDDLHLLGRALVAGGHARPVALVSLGPDGRPLLVPLTGLPGLGMDLLKCADAVGGLVATPEADVKRLT